MLWKKLKTEKIKSCNEVQQGLLTVAKIQQISDKKIQNNLSSMPIRKYSFNQQITNKDIIQDLKLSNNTNNKRQQEKNSLNSHDNKGETKQKYGKVTQTLYITNSQGNPPLKSIQLKQKQLRQFHQSKFQKDSQWYQQNQQKQKYSNQGPQDYQIHTSHSQIPPTVNQVLQKSQSKSMIMMDQKKLKNKRPSNLLLSFQLQSQIQPSEKNVAHKGNEHSPKTGNFKYIDNSFNKLSNQNPLAEFQSNSSQMKMDDFFKQLQQAGIDICDEHSQQVMGQQKIGEIMKKTQKNGSQMSKKMSDQNLQQKKNSSGGLEKRDISFKFDQRQKKQDKIKQIRKNGTQNLPSLKLMRQQIRNFYYILNDFDQWFKKESSKWAITFTDTLNKVLINKKNQINEQNKTIQQLRFQILKLEDELLQRQTINQEQIELINELRTKNQQLTENIFDAEQKAAQCDLLIQNKMQAFIGNYSPQKSQSSTKFKDNINKLNQQVQQLTRLYQASLQQNRKIKQTQMQNIKLQMDKLTLKQQNLLNRQLLLEKQIQKFQLRLEQLEEEELKFQLQKQRLFKMQRQFEEMEKVLEQKFIKVQQLQSQLSNGFNYIEEGKKQNQAFAKKLQDQRLITMKMLSHNEKKANHYDFSSLNFTTSKNNHHTSNFCRNEQKYSQPNLLIDKSQIKRPNPTFNAQNNQPFRKSYEDTQQGHHFFKSQQQIINKTSPSHTDINRYNRFRHFDEDGYNIYPKYQNKNNGILNYHENTYSRSSLKKNQSINTQRFYNIFNKLNRFAGTSVRSHQNLLSPQLTKSNPKSIKICESKIYKLENSRMNGFGKKQAFLSSSKLDSLDTKIEELKNQIKKQISAAKSQ